MISSGIFLKNPVWHQKRKRRRKAVTLAIPFFDVSGKKIIAAGGDDCIRSIYGVGYKMQVK